MNPTHSTRRCTNSRRTALLAASMLAGLVVGTPRSDAASPDAIAIMAALLSRSASLPQTSMPAPTDLGVVDGSTQVSLTFYLVPRNQGVLAALVSAVQAPGNRRFHKFQSVAEYTSRFAPTAASLASLTSIIQSMGFTVTHVTSNGLAVETRTTAANASAMFGVELHTMSAAGRSGIMPGNAAILPARLADVRAVGGLDTFNRPSPGPVPSVSTPSRPV